ncbi:MAG: FeoA family protein [Dethiobacteria bacterium]
MKVVSLVDMKTGQSGRIRQIYGGRGMTARLQALGLFPGKRITKLSSVLRGPVVVEIDRTRVALGHGCASRIFAEIEK